MLVKQTEHCEIQISGRTLRLLQCQKSLGGTSTKVDKLIGWVQTEKYLRSYPFSYKQQLYSVIK